MSDLEDRQRAVLELGLDDFVVQGEAGLPTGWAWARDPGTVRRALLRGLLGRHSHAWDRTRDLLTEGDPRSARETIDAWERDCGLPDPCTGPLDTLQERRMAVVAKRQSSGGQSRAYYIAVAAALGYSITITEFESFRAGRGRCGDRVHGIDWNFTWRVNASEWTFRYFRAGQSTAGEALRKWGNRLLECVLGALKPAHTILQFAYHVTSRWDDGRSIWDDRDSIWDVPEGI